MLVRKRFRFLQNMVISWWDRIARFSIFVSNVLKMNENKYQLKIFNFKQKSSDLEANQLFLVEWPTRKFGTGLLSSSLSFSTQVWRYTLHNLPTLSATDWLIVWVGIFSYFAWPQFGWLEFDIQCVYLFWLFQDYNFFLLLP